MYAQYFLPGNHASTFIILLKALGETSMFMVWYFLQLLKTSQLTLGGMISPGKRLSFADNSKSFVVMHSTEEFSSLMTSLYVKFLTMIGWNHTGGRISSDP